MGWRMRAGIAAAAAMMAVSARAEVAREAIVPAGAAVVLRVQAAGVQIYDCAASAGGGMAWRFREPLATLMVDGKTVGRHFAGPSWEMDDGSRVRGRVVEQAPGESAQDIAWLRLAAVAPSGPGALGKVTGVARIDTLGGVFGGACTVAGALHLEPYAATYVFWGGD